MSLSYVLSLISAAGSARYTYNIGSLATKGNRSRFADISHALTAGFPLGGYEHMRGDFIPCVPSDVDAFVQLGYN